MDSESLLDFVRRELPKLRATRSVRDIAEAAGVDKWWLAKLCDGKIEDPGVTKVEKLAAYLRSLNHPTPVQ